MFTSEQKAIIIASRVMGESNVDLKYKLYDETGHKTTSHKLANDIKDDEKLQDAIETVKQYIVDNLEDIVDIDEDSDE